MRDAGQDARRLLWLGLGLGAAAAVLEVLWLARDPQPDGGMVFAVGRLGLRLALPRSAFEALAVAAAAAGVACAVWAFRAASRALLPEGAGAPSRGRELAALALLLVLALPLHMAIGWADGHLARNAAYNAEWHRQRLFRELALGSSRQLLWLGALLALGAWLALRPSGRWSGGVSRACEAAARAPRGALVALACAAFLGIALAYTATVTRGLPDYLDAHGYAFQARSFASGRLWSPLPADQDFFNPRHCPHPADVGFVFLQDRWFFCGPPFGPLLYAAGLLAGCLWLVPPLLGAATVLLTYFVAKDCFGPMAGLVALPLCLASGWLIFTSGDYLTHLPCAVPMLVFILAVKRALRHGSWRWAAAAGLSLGLGVNARPLTAAALCLPFAVAWAVWLARNPRRAWMPTLAFALALAAPVAGLLAFNAATTGHPLTFGHELAWRDALQGAQGMDLTPDWRWRPIVGLATALQAGFFFGPAMHHWPIPAAGAILAAAVLLGIWRGADGDRWPLLVGLAALSLAVAYSRSEADPLVWQWPSGPRYVFEALPLFVVLAAGGIVALHARLGAAGIAPGRARAVLALALGLCVLYGTVATVAYELPKVGGSFHEPRLTAEVGRAAGTPAIVFLPVTKSHRAACAFAAAVARNDPAMNGPVVFARDLGKRNPELMRALPDRRCYRWDRAAGRLVPLASDGVSLEDAGAAPSAPPAKP